MTSGTLTIDHGAIASNYRALDAVTTAEMGAVVKADGYGLGAAEVSATLAAAGARRFFVATAAEGAAVRAAVGDAREVYVFSGHMAGDAEALAADRLIPLINSPEQWIRHREALPGHPFGLQLDTGMSRLGLAPDDWRALRDEALGAAPAVVISHLACADEPDHPQNAAQLAAFRAMTDGIRAPRSLAATGGTLLGPDYAFDLTRPGIGLYGGAPFTSAEPVVSLSLPVIQTREIPAGASVGYGATFTAEGPRRIATVSGGYADGLLRALSNGAPLWAGDRPCPLAGRVSMDLMGVDVTGVDGPIEALQVLGPAQGIDALADAAGTIGYEILTSLGARYDRNHVSGA